MATVAAAPQPVRYAPPKVRRTQCLIGGKWLDAARGETFATYNPATEEFIAETAPEGVDKALPAAR